MLIPDIGSTCKYVFTTPFAALDGIYTLTHVTAFDTALVDEVDFVTSLYEPAGRTKEDYEDEFTAFRGNVVLKLEHIESGLVIYVPKVLIDKVPDPMILKAHNLNIAINLGFIEDPASVAWIMTELQDIASSLTGTPRSAVLLSAGQKWMTRADYTALDEERKTRVRQIIPMAVELKQQRDMIARLQDKIQAYEALLVSLNANTP